MISDTHYDFVDKFHWPEADVLLHCGDATFQGTTKEIIGFNKELGKLKEKYSSIVVTPGNHDWLYEQDPVLAKELTTNAIVLIDELIEINGIRIYGSPHSPTFFNLAFNLDRGPKIKEKWDLIPQCDILITHSPPYGYGDECQNGKVGCQDLLDKVREIKPKIHAFGHIHENYGIYDSVEGIKYINASTCNEKYKHTNQPVVFKL